MLTKIFFQCEKCALLLLLATLLCFVAVMAVTLFLPLGLCGPSVLLCALPWRRVRLVYWKYVNEGAWFRYPCSEEPAGSRGCIFIQAGCKRIGEPYHAEPLMNIPVKR